MIVVIEDEVFASAPNLLDLLSVFQLGASGRHRVQTDPLYPSPGSRLDTWLKNLGNEALRDEVTLALEIGLEQDARGLPADISLRITKDSQPAWTSTPPRLPLKTALSFLQEKLRLLVENRHNDGAFLRTVAPGAVRKELLRALAAGWAEIEHGGGMDIRARIETASHQEAMRLWVLSDSDAREPGRPSEAQLELRQSCVERGVAHYLLQRRASENYLPPQALAAWPYSGPKNTQAARRDTVKTFARLRPKQRHHYNMKYGFSRDRPNIPPLFADCSEHPHLQRGFGENIKSWFHHPISENFLRKDDQQEETLAMVQSILRRL